MLAKRRDALCCGELHHGDDRAFDRARYRRARAVFLGHQPVRRRRRARLDLRRHAAARHRASIRLCDRGTGLRRRQPDCRSRTVDAGGADRTRGAGSGNWGAGRARLCLHPLRLSRATLAEGLDALCGDLGRGDRHRTDARRLLFFGPRLALRFHRARAARAVDGVPGATASARGRGRPRAGEDSGCPDRTAACGRADGECG